MDLCEMATAAQFIQPNYFGWHARIEISVSEVAWAIGVVEMLRVEARCRGLDRRSMPDADRFDFSIAALAIVIWI